MGLLKSGRAVKVLSCRRALGSRDSTAMVTMVPGMCSSDSPSLPSDHHDTILGKLAAAHFVAQLAAVREVPASGPGTSYQPNSIERERVCAVSRSNSPSATPAYRTVTPGFAAPSRLTG
jgi:hypothetical protein